MLDSAIGFPRRGESTLKTLLIGGAFLLFGIFVFPTLFVYGYLMQVLRDGGGDADPPSFGDWETLLVDGVKYYAVTFVYSIVPALLIVVFAFAVGASVLAMGAAGSTGGSGVFVAVGFLVGIPVVGGLSLGAMYLMPAALALVARTGEVGAAFDLGTLKQVTFTSDYLVAFLLFLVIMVVGSIVGAVLILAFLLGLLVIFYTQVAAYYVIATVVDDLLDEAEASDT